MIVQSENNTFATQAAVTDRPAFSKKCSMHAISDHTDNISVAAPAINQTSVCTVSMFLLVWKDMIISRKKHWHTRHVLLAAITEEFYCWRNISQHIEHVSFQT